MKKCKTTEEVRAIYNRACGPKDYKALTEQLGFAIQNEYQLSDAQRDYVMGKAYADYHSHFSDMLNAAGELAEFCMNFPCGGPK